MTSPVDTFDHSVEEFRSQVRERMPFTFIAYRSLIPEKEDDWYYLASKVAWVVFIAYQLVEFAAKWSLFMAAIPFIPFIMDVVWMGYQCIDKKHHVMSPTIFKITQVVGFTLFSGIGVAFLFNRMSSM